MLNQNNLSLKYQRFTSSGCKDVGIRNLVSRNDSIHLHFCLQGMKGKGTGLIFKRKLF